MTYAPKSLACMSSFLTKNRHTVNELLDHGDGVVLPHVHYDIDGGPYKNNQHIRLFKFCNCFW